MCRVFIAILLFEVALFWRAFHIYWKSGHEGFCCTHIYWKRSFPVSISGHVTVLCQWPLEKNTDYIIICINYLGHEFDKLLLFKCLILHRRVITFHFLHKNSYRKLLQKSVGNGNSEIMYWIFTLIEFLRDATMKWAITTKYIYIVDLKYFTQLHNNLKSVLHATETTRNVGEGQVVRPYNHNQQLVPNSTTKQQEITCKYTQSYFIKYAHGFHEETLNV